MADFIPATEQYLQRVTGRAGYFNLLQSGPAKVAIFRRLSFIVPDELSMIRLRLADEITRRIQTSVLNGFLIGEISFARNGAITKGLDPARRQLLDYLLDEPMDAFTVTRFGANRYQIHYPNDFVEFLIARAVQRSGARPKVKINRHQWRVRVVHTTGERLAALFRMDREAKTSFLRRSRPCVLIGFGRTIDVSGAMSFRPERQSQLSDRVFEKLFAAYERFKRSFLSGKRATLSPRFELPEITSLPLPPIVNRDRRQHQKILRCLKTYLHDCVQAGRVRCRFKGKWLSGRIVAPDPAIYPPVWLIDQCFNTLAMADFDIGLAKEMLRGGFIRWMTLSGSNRGRMQVKLAEPAAAN